MTNNALSKNKQLKAKIVDEIVAKIEKAKSIVIVDYRGTNVVADTELRSALRKEKVEYKVLKNRLVLKALNQKGYTGLDKVLEGTSAFAFSYEDPVVAAKVIEQKASTGAKLVIKGGIVEGKVLDAKDMAAVAKIPSKPVLIAQMLGLLQSPIRGLAVAISEIAKQKA